MPRLASAPPSSPPPDSTELAQCCAVFVPADPARTGAVAFWRPDGAPPPAVAAGSATDLTVALPGEDGVEPVTVPALLLPVRTALPLLAHARAVAQEGGGNVHRAAAFWSSAALLALHFTARGLLLPGLSPTDHDTWRSGPYTAQDVERIRRLAASMPPEAHAVPLGPARPLRLPDPERLLRAFLDAVADTLPRTPAAPLVTDGPVFAAWEPQHAPGLSAWAADVAAGHDAGLRLSLRIEIPGLPEAAPGGPAPDEDTPDEHTPYDHSPHEETLRFRAVPQLHSLRDPARVVDAADLWAAPEAETEDAFGPRARMDALVALRRAVRAWPPLTPLLSTAVPDAVDLADEEVTDLLGNGSRALAQAGVEVHWPRSLARTLTTRAVVGPPDESAGSGGDASHMPSFLSADAPLTCTWWFGLGEQGLTRAELDRLAEASRPLVRLRDQWVLIDPQQVRQARARQERKVTPIDALGAALTGTTEVDGRHVEVRATGWLAALRDRLIQPETAQEPAGEPTHEAAQHGAPDPAHEVPQPAALAATLRGYQRRGLSWLARTTSLGLGCCLADDMGLGKTITLIALHLHRQSDPASAGPTLVVCPTSLMGNWQREIERFAPGTAVRRFHGPRRALDAVADGEFVLTTYGTLRTDAIRLAEVSWGLVVADEAQHVKNPRSATARALRTLGAHARVALTGTPVENNLSDLWAILDWTTPGLLGRLGTFRTRYARAVEGGRDPAAARRLARLVGPFLLRRRKSDPGIAPELPPKTETDRAVALTPEQAGLYEAVVRETLARISAADDMARRGLIVQLMTGLKQICNHPAQYLKEENPTIAGRSGKLELLDELLDTILAEGASVLVFTQYVSMARLLERHLADRGVPTMFLHGGTPVADREAMVRRFQDGEVPVFLLSLKAAGTGLNLTRAEHVVHVDRWWNPAVEAQATDRAHRIGQTRPVQVHRLIAEGTIEDRIAQMLSRKRELAEAVLGPGEAAALTELTDAELAELVELRGGDR
ncbi:ATP-dependent helicase [Streptomyces sp. Ru71]|uniref:DEAD/DEAH box helicase n=1 Tax=Streptomyces sp. Ru71 TaxID=2080746 RepID=UPI000CDD0ACA|nr:DEAD/DEAH box helicase [Streptomyces sp. Ru71]POX45819.1 ATP-dependent helicase [Streptomyces sp. Ru71]